MYMRSSVISAMLLLVVVGCAVEPGVQVGVSVPGIVVSAADPYYYSPTYCAGCWYGQWGGRIGYHRGGGRPWERPHAEADHHGRSDGRDVRHEGHR